MDESESHGSSLKARTAAGFFWGMLGNGALQVLGLVFGIFLARLLTPADYGVVGALTIFSAVAGLLSESGFTLAIVNRQTVTQRDLNSVFWFNVAASLALYAILFFSAPLIARFYRMEEMVPLSRFLFLAFVFGGLSTTPSAILFRNLRVKQRSLAMLTAVAVSGTIGVICAANGWKYWGIAMQTVFYSATLSVLLWVMARWRPDFEFDWKALKSMLPFSSKQLATALFTHINNNFFAMLLARLYSMSATGFFTQGNKWVTMGSSTVNGMVSNVGQPVMRQVADDRERLRRVFRKMLRFAVFISFPALGGLAAVAPEFIVLTVTDKWIECVPVMRILCIWGAFLPVATLYGNLFNSIDRPSVYMWLTIGLGLLQLACVAVTAQFGLFTMLWVYSGINVCWLLIWQTFAKRAIGLKFRSIVADILPILAVAAGTLAIAELAAQGIPSIVWSLIVKIIVAVILYFCASRIFLPELFNEAMAYLKKKC